MTLSSFASVPILVDSLFVFTLAAIFVGLGTVGSRLIISDQTKLSSQERLLLRFGFGAATISLATFLLGCAGQFNRSAFVIELIIATAIGFKSLSGNFQELLTVIGSAKRAVPRSLPCRIICGIFGICLIALLFQAMSPPLDPDGLGYHLQAPKRWLQSGNLRYLPTMVQTQSPMGLEMIYSLCISLVDDTSAKLVHYLFGCAAALSAFCLGSRLFGRRAGLIAAGLFCLGIPKNYGFGEFGIAYVDLGAAFALTLGVLLWVIAIQEERDSAFVASALVLGFGASMKLALLPAGLLLSIVSNQYFRSLPRATWLKFNLLAVAPVIPWLVRSWYLTGNPVWPMFSTIIPTRDWTPALSRDYSTYMRYTIWAEDSLKFSMPMRTVMVLIAVVIVLGLGVAFAQREQDRTPRNIWGFATGLTLFTIYGGGLYLRYFLPIFPVVIALIVSPLALEKRWNAVRWGLVAWFAVNGALLLKGMNPGLGENARVALGVIPREQYLQRNYGDYPLIQSMNKSVGSVLATGTGATYYLDAYCFLADGIRQGAINLSSVDALAESVKEFGIQRVLVADGEPRLHGGVLFPEVADEAAMIKSFVESRCVRLDRMGRLTLYLVK
ncbi:MAG: glycosyltransferase family 39 protein [Chthonomonadales bacterium]